MSSCLPTALLICCAPFVALADTHCPPPPTPHLHHHRATPDELALRMLVRSLVLQRYDANQNGHLDRAEREVLRHETREALRQQAAAVAAQFDLDKDGMLSPEEREAMHRSFESRRKKHGPNRHHRRSQHHEAQHQGVDNATPQPPKAHRRKHHRKHRRMGKFAREMAFITHRLLLQAYDTDGSGQLEEQEMVICRQDAAKLYEKRKGELLQRFDTDQDGQIAEAEFQLAKAQILLPLPAERKRRRLTPEAVDDLALLRHLAPTVCSPSTN